MCAMCCGDKCLLSPFRVLTFPIDAFTLLGVRTLRDVVSRVPQFETSTGVLFFSVVAQRDLTRRCYLRGMDPEGQICLTSRYLDYCQTVGQARWQRHRDERQTYLGAEDEMNSCF